MIRFNLIVAALAAAAVMLGAASAAEAGLHVSMSSSQGLVVTTDNPREIRCARIHAGVSISTQGGDDNIHVGTSASDPVSIDAGSGNDLVTSASNLQRHPGRAIKRPVDGDAWVWKRRVPG